MKKMVKHHKNLFKKIGPSSHQKNVCFDEHKEAVVVYRALNRVCDRVCDGRNSLKDKEK
jgi:hypothetical protein